MPRHRKNLPNYKITFDDATTATCDNEHLWTLLDNEVKPVAQLQPGDKIAVAKPLQLPEQKLPIDPYLLGIWLADGKHTSGEITNPEEQIWNNITACGYQISPNYSAKAQDDKCRVHTIYGLRTHLRSLNLFGHKHIPQQYLRASYSQRLALLQGLLDGDGSANHTRKQVVINTTSKALALQYHELILSLGQRATFNPYIAKGFGKTTPAYTINFRPNNIAPFRLSRKLNKTKNWGPGRSTFRRITKIEELPTNPTQCIAVDSPDHTFLCTKHFIPTHNTGKSFGNEVSHTQQGQLYAVALMVMFPEAESIAVEFWYLDEGKKKQRHYTRAKLTRIMASFNKRGQAMTSATTFPAKANAINCKWCEFGVHKGNGTCQYAVNPTL